MAQFFQVGQQCRTFFFPPVLLKHLNRLSKSAAARSQSPTRMKHLPLLFSGNPESLGLASLSSRARSLSSSAPRQSPSSSRITDLDQCTHCEPECRLQSHVM